MFNFEIMKLSWHLGLLLLCPLLAHQVKKKEEKNFIKNSYSNIDTSILPQRTTPALPYYVGAVVQYAPAYVPSGEKTATDINAENYVRIIKRAAELVSNQKKKKKTKSSIISISS